MEKLNYNSILEEASIPVEVRNAISLGNLTVFKPLLAWVSDPRAFLMTSTLKTQIEDALASDDPSTVKWWEKLVADISFFVEGGLINWGLMKWLDPKKYEHWELKSTRPRPSFRVFGRFAFPDVFVGTHVVKRTELKGKWTIEWELEKLNCEDHWKAALGNFAAFSAPSYEGYITENARKEVRIER